jgi:hypothetical protein
MKRKLKLKKSPPTSILARAEIGIMGTFTDEDS